MESRDIILSIIGIALAAVLTVWGTARMIDWLNPSDPYGGTVHGTGKLPDK